MQFPFRWNGTFDTSLMYNEYSVACLRCQLSCSLSSAVQSRTAKILRKDEGGCILFTEQEWEAGTWLPPAFNLTTYSLQLSSLNEIFIPMCLIIRNGYSTSYKRQRNIHMDVLQVAPRSRNLTLYKSILYLLVMMKCNSRYPKRFNEKCTELCVEVKQQPWQSMTTGTKHMDFPKSE
jgi:hypothetical protein